MGQGHDATSGLTAAPGGSTIVVMKDSSIRAAVVAVLPLLGFAGSGTEAGVIPSKAESGATTADSDRARLQAVLARTEVAQALAAHGLVAKEVEGRLAELSPEDLRALAANVDQLQAAGTVPNYIWILLGIFLAVSILVAVF